MREYQVIVTARQPAIPSISASRQRVAVRYEFPVCFSCGETYVAMTEVACPFCGSTELSEPASMFSEDAVLTVGAD
jgi:hypothetical protein